MSLPKKAIILAAGLGTRMRPLTLGTPKALLPHWGRPVIDRILEMLHKWGVREVLINLHHAPHALVERFRTGPHPGLRICLSFEHELLGTGGAVRRGAWFLDSSPFWMINSDIVVANLTPRPFLKALQCENSLAALWVTDQAGPRTVEVRNGAVVNFRSEQPGGPGTYTFCGLQLLSPSILEFLPLHGPSSIVSAYERAIATGWSVSAVCVRGSTWADVGSLPGYLAAHTLVQPPSALLARLNRRLNHAGITVRGFAALSKNVTVHKGTVLENVVLFDGVVIASASTVRNAVLGPDVRVAGPVTGLVVAARNADQEWVLRAIRHLGWPVAVTAVQPLPPRGSDRTFVRLLWGHRRAIAVHYGAERAENARYTHHALFLRRLGVRVPGILADSPSERLCILEDLGDQSLLDLLRLMGTASAVAVYRRVLDQVILMHSLNLSAIAAKGVALEEPFSPRVYRYEHNLFIQYYLKRRFDSAHIKTIELELRTVQKRLAREPLCLIHRDLQATNVLLHRGCPTLIDFQGMRMGPAVYDLASLLCDPYVSLPESLQNQLLAYYAQRRHLNLPQLEEAFWWAAVERLVQAVGAFGRLGDLPETKHFSRYIGPALRMLKRALDHVDNLPRLQETVTKALQVEDKRVHEARFSDWPEGERYAAKGAAVYPHCQRR